MFNIGGSEVLVIALIALIVVGPEQLPSVLRKAGKEMARFRSMTSSIRDEFMAGVEEMDPTTWDNAPRTAAKPISTPEEFRAHLDDEERRAEERAMGEAGRQAQEAKFSASAATSDTLMPSEADVTGAVPSADSGASSDVRGTNAPEAASDAPLNAGEISDSEPADEADHHHEIGDGQTTMADDSVGNNDVSQISDESSVSHDSSTDAEEKDAAK